MPVTTKCGKVVAYHEEFKLIKFHDPSIEWFCEARGKLTTLYLKGGDLLRGVSTYEFT